MYSEHIIVFQNTEERENSINFRRGRGYGEKSNHIKRKGN
jgi:hypothetical protein